MAFQAPAADISPGAIPPAPRMAANRARLPASATATPSPAPSSAGGDGAPGTAQAELERRLRRFAVRYLSAAQQAMVPEVAAAHAGDPDGDRKSVV